LLAGLGCTVVGLLLSQTTLIPPRLLFLAAGVLLAGIAVSRRLQTTSWELEDRVESAGVLALSAFVALLAYLGMEPSWDSGRIFLGAVIAAALLGSFIVLLPRTGRRIAALFLVLLHFGAILTSVTAVPPRNEPAPWLSMQLWTQFYRPYLWFAYLTNAYHFYSPDPGPPTLLWFHVEYDDGTARWIKIPNRHESSVSLYHQRMLATAENAHNPIYGPSLDAKTIPKWKNKFKREYELLPGIKHDPWEEIYKRRAIGASLPFTDPEDHNRLAPLHLVIMSRDTPTVMEQFSEPQELARRLIASYARHIARTSPDPKNANNAVKAVRVYRVVHDIISPRELSEGKEPWDPTTFKPYYMGQYNADGKLLDPHDPFLFWWVPIIRASTRFPDEFPWLTVVPPEDEQLKIIDFVEIHATQSDKFQKTQ
jgi:hypothetical protein